jgi:PEP-CTERM motif
MKRTFSALAIAALVVVSGAPAKAGAIYTANFMGTVFSTEGATGESVGSTVTGHFDLDSNTGSFLDFSIAGRSVAAGYLSFAAIGPALFDATYTAQVSPVALATPSNSSFTLDLSSLSTWPSTDTVYTLLTDGVQLATNLDTVNNPLSAFPSTFGYYTANPDGTNVVALSANLTSITAAAAATPEPGTFALLGCSLLGAGIFAARRRASGSR